MRIGEFYWHEKHPQPARFVSIRAGQLVRCASDIACYIVQVELATDVKALFDSS